MAANYRIRAWWKSRVEDLKVQTIALYYAYRDLRTPWPARLVTALVVAYALSPIDLIPDFIPFLGYLDDFILIPLGIILALRLIPPDVWAESQEKARLLAEKPVSYTGALLVGAIWLILVVISLQIIGQVLS